MILTTTHSIQGHKIVDYLGIVSGVSYNSNYSYKGNKLSFKEMFSMSKYYESYSKGLEDIKEEAFQKLKENAQKLGANAVVGITVDVETMLDHNVNMVSVTGTAVKAEY